MKKINLLCLDSGEDDNSKTSPHSFFFSPSDGSSEGPGTEDVQMTFKD